MLSTLEGFGMRRFLLDLEVLATDDKGEYRVQWFILAGFSILVVCMGFAVGITCGLLWSLVLRVDAAGLVGVGVVITFVVVGKLLEAWANWV